MSPTNRPLSVLLALAAQLRLGALGLVAELMAALGAGRLAAALRRRMARDVARLEAFATGMLVLMALKALPPAPEVGRGGRRPWAAPRGFARVGAEGDPLRAMRRHLFPRDRDLSRRLRRLDAVLDRALETAARVARRIARLPPLSRLLIVAPPALAHASCADGLAPALADTS